MTYKAVPHAHWCALVYLGHDRGHIKLTRVWELQSRANDIAGEVRDASRDDDTCWFTSERDVREAAREHMEDEVRDVLEMPEWMLESDAVNVRAIARELIDTYFDV